MQFVKHSKSMKIDKIYCFPGNAGTEEIAENELLISITLKALKTLFMKK